MFIRRNVMSLLCASALVFAACGDSEEDPKPTVDQGVTSPDSGGQVKQPPASVDCDGDCKEYAMRRLVMPINDSTNKYSYMQGGKPYNQLGAILTFFKDMPMQAAMDESVTAGLTVFLIRLKSSDFTNMTDAVGQAWVGGEEPCCADPEDLAACTTEAEAKCYTGTYEFTKGSSTATFIGDIASGKFNMHGNAMNIELPLSGTDTLTLPLKTLQVRGTLEGDNIKDGAIAGAIAKEDVETKLIPEIAKLLTGLLADPTVEESTKGQLRVLDSDKDDVISADELKKTVGGMLSGDVDVDDDGTDELSLGVGFEAVKGVIK